VLALPTSMCLCAPIGVADLPQRQRRQAMLYRLEEKLPVAAEDVAADFVESGDLALGIAVERRTLRPLAAAAEAAGLRVRAVCPASLLAVQQRADTDGLVLWRVGRGRAELFSLGGGVPVAWYALADDPDDVALHVRMATAGAADAPAVAERNDSVIESAIEAVAARRRPWIDLLRADGAGGASSGGVAGRGPGRWAAAAAVVFLGCVVAAMLWRSGRYDALAARSEAEQQAVFRETFPGQAVPPDVRSRLLSEARQVSDAPAGAAAAQAGDLVVLRDVLSYLPGETRFRVSDLRVEDGEFVLEGEARSHGDAEAVAASLRRRAGFTLAPPRTEQRAGRAVGFTLTGGVSR
jgi:type II secretory pathway component PulL